MGNGRSAAWNFNRSAFRLARWCSGNNDCSAHFKQRNQSRFLSSFAVGITNPAAILTFLFAFSYFGISAGAGLLRGIMLVCGVFIGTYIWWGTLTTVTNIIKRKTRKFSFRYMNRIFGTVLCLFGIFVLLRLIIK